MVVIIIQGVGGIDKGLLYEVGRGVGEVLGAHIPGFRVIVSAWPLSPPMSAYDWSRMQYRADEVNLFLSKVYSRFIKTGERLVLGVIKGDGYVPGLNFVFGLANRDLGVASVYTRRLHVRDASLFIDRLVKECVHELGHLLGLNHCSNPRCVMSFSNSVAEVDRKSKMFCEDCSLKLTV